VFDYAAALAGSIGNIYTTYALTKGLQETQRKLFEDWLKNIQGVGYGRDTTSGNLNKFLGGDGYFFTPPSHSLTLGTYPESWLDYYRGFFGGP